MAKVCGRFGAESCRKIFSLILDFCCQNKWDHKPNEETTYYIFSQSLCQSLNEVKWWTLRLKGWLAAGLNGDTLDTSATLCMFQMWKERRKRWCSGYMAVVMPKGQRGSMRADFLRRKTWSSWPPTIGYKYLDSSTRTGTVWWRTLLCGISSYLWNGCRTTSNILEETRIGWQYSVAPPERCWWVRW